MNDVSIVDEYGKRTRFKGEKLSFESTDSAASLKPQWREITVWRTEAGSYVVKRESHYRIRHLSDRCHRAEGYDLVDATEIDTYPCQTCNKQELIEPGKGFAQMSRIQVDVYEEPEHLIASFRVDERYSQLSRTILADVSEQDDRVDAMWNEVVVP